MKAIRPDVNLPEMEREVLDAWNSGRIFAKQNERRANAREFAFYDGPPFANGLPHYGHLLANTIKDIVPRYWIMRGFKVERKFGWDCHGVPVEYEIEKRDNLKGSGAIKDIGIGEFNERCRASVLHYAKEWEKTITRIGRWVDWNNQYRTMDRSFMESVWWVFSELHKKGLVYRSHKVVPYSPRLTSVLSNFEANQNYKMTQDPSVYVRFKMRGDQAYFLAWTTTPWTLISNLALAVGPDIDYVKVRHLADGQIYWLAEARLDAVFKKPKSGEAQVEVLERVKGTALAGKTYEPLFPYFAGHKNAFQVLVDTYVTTSDGTGIVHQAPAYGEDDFRVCRAAGIDFVDPIDDEGRFKSSIPEYVGVDFKEADKEICRRLKAEGKLIRQETLDHSYPFCDRTDTPLMYRAVPCWYVAVEKIVPKLVANNQKINWVPAHLKDGRMGNWLENARDWAISRNRFWGTPLPIWMCQNHDDHIEVFGEAAQLEERAGRKLGDLHKHFIDDISFKCTHCNGMMRRVPEVFDCWFESGSMPYAQLHYPFENKERLETIFPADFIAEGLDQTRGWFYTLSVLSTALFDRPAFKNVVVNGIICDETGKKMSKRHRNYTPPDELLEKYGADATRLYMVNSPILRGEDLIFSDKGVIETIRAVILPLWNAQSFLTTYAEADGWKPNAALAAGQRPELTGEMDRWIVSRLQTMIKEVHRHMEQYHLYAVVPVILGFIDELTNWYIRLSRRRFWGKADDATEKSLSSDQIAAYETLYYVLVEFTKVFAPFAPFVSDRVYRNLTAGLQNVPESVHLTDIPTVDAAAIDTVLEANMALVRRATELGRSLRAKHQIKTRQPLPNLLVITRNVQDKAAIDKGQSILREELNVKAIEFSTEESKFVRLGVKPNLKTLGKKLGSSLGQVRSAFEALSADPAAVAEFLLKAETQGRATVAGHELTVEDLLIERGPKDDRLIATESGVTVLLDTKVNQELLYEGYAREVVSRLQNLRKESGLNVTDRIKISVACDDELREAIATHTSYINGETLGTTLEFVSGIDSKHQAQSDVDGRKLHLGLVKV
jgi:isoleucyl-tRNA synthetase